MTLDQGLAFTIVAAMMGLFVWGRLRYDLVAMLALLASVAVGIVPADEAFTGFSDDIVIIVAQRAAGQCGRRAIRHRRAADLAARAVSRTVSARSWCWSASVTLLSAFVKNVGALAILMPIAFQLARRTGTSPSSLLMPMAFGSLLGGLMTLVGTSPNVIVARMREELLGQPFTMFDFTPVGAGLAAVGVVFLVFGYRLLPMRPQGGVSIDAAFNIEDYTTEASVPEDSPLRRQDRRRTSRHSSDGDVEVTTLIRERFAALCALPRNAVLHAGDILILRGRAGGAGAHGRARRSWSSATGSAARDATAGDEVGVDGGRRRRRFAARRPRSAGGSALRSAPRVNLLAVSRSGERITPAPARRALPGRRRRRAAGRSRRPAGDARRAAPAFRLPSATSASAAARRRLPAADRAGRRDGAVALSWCRSRSPSSAPPSAAAARASLTLREAYDAIDGRS